MTAGRTVSALGALLAALCGCAHAPAPPRVAPEVVWPRPPERARVRLVAELPQATARALPWWRRTIDAVIGLEPGAAPEGRLARPFGVVSGAAGEVIVADPDGRQVVRLRDDRDAAPIECAGRPWGAPMAVARAADGTLYVADAARGAVVRVGAGGECRDLSADLARPTGVAVSGDAVFVADPPRHEIVVLSTAGGVVRRFGARGDEPGQLNFPTAVALDGPDRILVVDALNFRIARFTLDGRWLGAFGSAGDEAGEFSRPKAVATDPAGNIYVTDAQRDLVLVFRTDGSFDYPIGETGIAPGRFAMPTGLDVAGGRLVVADSHNRRVQIFELAGGGT